MTTQQFLIHAKEHYIPSKEELLLYVQQLREELRRHNYLYHIQEAPVISDFDYDLLFSHLVELEEAFPELVTQDSPTQRLAIGTDTSFAPVTHLAPLLSLANTYNDQELLDYDKRTTQALHAVGYKDTLEYIAELKLDGLSIALVYEDDRLVRAATRGNGNIGEDVTANIRTIGSIPLYAPFSRYGITTIEIRGEIIMSQQAFNELNLRRAAHNESLFANPRNAASGSLRQLNPKITKERKLDGYFYNINYLEGAPHPATQEEAYQLLLACGIKVNPYYKRCTDIQAVYRYCEEMEAKRATLPYEIDGVVVKVNATKAREQLGTTEHHPRSDIAYKFKAQEAITKLQDITVQVGRTGILTPVAELEPVELGGVVVKRATLHNEEDLQRKGVHIGDYVVIKRAGDVIPAVVKPIIERREEGTYPFRMPDQCPVCSAHIEYAKLTPKDAEIKELQDKAKSGDISAKLICILRVLQIPGLTPTSIKKISATYLSLEEFVYTTTEELISKTGISEAQAQLLTNYIITNSIGVTEAEHACTAFLEIIIIPHAFCPNLSCPAQIKGRLEHFVSKHAMDIEGFGTKLISRFVDEGIIHDFADIYHLKEEQERLRTILYDQESKTTKEATPQLFATFTEENVGEQKLLYNLLRNIEVSKTQPLERLLVGLNIPNVGKKTAKVLASQISSLWDLVTWPIEQLATLPDIGSITAESIHDYLAAEENQTLLRRLEAAGVQMQGNPTKTIESSWKYREKKFIFTGELTTMSREEAQQQVEQRGGITVSSISKKTDFCVVGANAGSKAQKAETLGVTILTEEEFREMLIA